MRYSTPWEFNNSMNSLKSACSFAKSTPVLIDQLEKNVEPLLGRQISIKLIIRCFGVFESAELLDDPLHGENCSMLPEHLRTP